MVSHYLQFTLEMQRSISMILVLGSWVSLLRLDIASGPLLKSVCVICKFELVIRFLHFFTISLFQGYQLHVCLSQYLLRNI